MPKHPPGTPVARKPAAKKRGSAKTKNADIPKLTKEETLKKKQEKIQEQLAEEQEKIKKKEDKLKLKEVDSYFKEQKSDKQVYLIKIQHNCNVSLGDKRGGI